MLLKLEEEKIKAEKEEAVRKKKEEAEMLKDAAPAEKAEIDAVDKAPTLTTGPAAPDKAPALTTDFPPEKRKSRVVELNAELELIKVGRKFG